MYLPTAPQSVALEAVTGRPFENIAPPTFVTTGKMPV